MNTYKTSKIYSILTKDLENAMLSHCYILHGQNEDVLLQLSKNVAKHVLCGANVVPCNICAICNNIENEIYSDVAMYPKNSKTINTENANQIVLDSYVRPLESSHKFFILNNFDNATVAAQNKLLKTIEEPSKNVIFIINTTNIFGVLDTIKSRSKIVYEMNETDEFNTLRQENLQELALDAMYNMKRSSEVLKTAFNIIDKEKDLEKFVETVQSFVLDIVKIKSGINQNQITNINKTYALQELADELSSAGLNGIMNSSHQLISEIRANTNKSLALETFLLKILEIKYKCKIGAL